MLSASLVKCLKYVYFQVQLEFKLLLPEASAKLISTWETRFVPSIIHICQMSRLPKVQALMKELFHPVSDSDDYVPSDGNEKNLYQHNALLCACQGCNGNLKKLKGVI